MVKITNNARNSLTVRARHVEWIEGKSYPFMELDELLPP